MESQMERTFMAVIAAVVGLFLLLGVGGLLWAYPQYQVYYQRLAGEAKLKEAESSRQIAVEEARAKLESSEMLGKARVIDAKSTADAVAIVGKSLRDNPEYVGWEFIQKIADNDNQVIYWPTEGGFPLLEMGRLNVPKGKKPEPNAEKVAADPKKE